MVSQFPRSNFFRKVADWRRAGCPIHRSPRALPGSNQARAPITSLTHQMLACLWFIAAGIFTSSCLAPHAGAATVDATLDRDSVPAGNGALLSLTITGNRVGQIQLPEVENLIIQGRDQSRQIQMNAGQTIVSLTCTYAVGSNTPGTYQIPPIAVSIDGQQLTTKPLTLKVLDAAAAQAPTPSGAPPAAGQAPDTSGKRFGFLTVELLIKDRNYLYVGEIAPVGIRAWLPEDSRAQLRSGIQPEGKAFTLHNVSERPQQGTEIKDGKRYTVITWYGGISATKAGKYPASLSLDATVAVRDTSAPKPRRRNGGPFDDPLFDSMMDRFNTPMIQEDVTLKSDDEEIEVRSLPTAGRPDGFTGAVGDFKFESADIPASWKTGEPQQISASLSGSGNFALLGAPTIVPPDAWKIYPGKSDLTPRDAAAFSASKRFQFSAVARKGGKQDVTLSFSFFDPAAAAYKTLTTSPKPVTVSGADLVDVQTNTPTVAPEPAKPKDPLVGQHSALTPVASLAPLVARPEFTRLLALGATLCVLGQAVAWLRRRRTDPARLAQAKMEMATREALQAAANCADRRDVAGFFEAARRAIQLRLGALWNQPAPAITLAEISARIPAESPVARFFHEADLSAYGRHAADDRLPHWRSLLAEALASLTPSAG